MTDLRSSPSGRKFQLNTSSLPSGLQTAWAIDPLTGNDEAVGSPSAPLRTMAEFNERMLNQNVQVAQTLQLVGNVTDAPLWLEGTRYALTGSLTVSGTRTVVASNAVVSSVTQLGDGGVGFPFQLVTTGIDWTLQPLGAQVRITGSSSAGNVNCFGFIASVTDANTVIVGSISTGTTTSGSGGNVTPLANDVLSVSTLSIALAPQINAAAWTTPQQSNGAFFTNKITIRDLKFSDNAGYYAAGSAGVNFVGCEFAPPVFGSFHLRSQIVFLACRFTLLQLFSIAGNMEYCRVDNSVIACDTATKTNRWTLQGGMWLLSRNTHNNAALRASQATTIEIQNHVNIRNTQIPFFIEEFTKVWALAVLGGSTGNTDSAMRIQSGSSYAWNGAAAKPNVAGATDPIIGGTTISYASIGTGFYALFNNANPNSILNLVGPGAGCWMAQF